MVEPVTAIDAVEPRRGRPGYDRRSVLEISVQTFNLHGYDATSIGILAARLGLSKSAIYHHFPSKEHLLEAALEEALGELESVLTEEGATIGSPAERLIHVLDRAVARAGRKAAVRHSSAAAEGQHAGGAGGSGPAPRVRPRRHRPGGRGAGRPRAPRGHRSEDRGAAAVRHDQLDRRVVPPEGPRTRPGSPPMSSLSPSTGCESVTRVRGPDRFRRLLGASRPG